jgi:hypothetical protein
MTIKSSKAIILFLFLISFVKISAQKITSTVSKTVESGGFNDWAKTENSDKIYNFKTEHKWNMEIMGLKNAKIQVFNNNLELEKEILVLQDLIKTKTGIFHSFKIEGNIKALFTSTYVKKKKTNILKYTEINIESGERVKDIIVKEFVKVSKDEQYEISFYRSPNKKHFALLYGMVHKKVQLFDADLNPMGEEKQINNARNNNFIYKSKISNDGIFSQTGRSMDIPKVNHYASAPPSSGYSNAKGKCSIFAASSDAVLTDNLLSLKGISDLTLNFYNNQGYVLYSFDNKKGTYTFKISGLPEPVNSEFETASFDQSSIKKLTSIKEEKYEQWKRMKVDNFVITDSSYSWNSCGTGIFTESVSSSGTNPNTSTVYSLFHGDQFNFEYNKTNSTLKTSVYKRFASRPSGFPITFNDGILGPITFMWAKDNYYKAEVEIYGKNHCNSLIPSSALEGDKKYGNATFLAILDDENKEKNISLRNLKKEMGNFDIISNPAKSVYKLKDGEYLYTFRYRNTAALASPVQLKLVKIKLQK